jgi:hypothetical protein
MGRGTLIALLLFTAVACESASPAPVQPDGGQFCTAGSHSCPAANVCANSYCTPICTGGAACPAGMYCPGPNPPDDVCGLITPIHCAVLTDCPRAQLCINARCVSAEAVADGGVELCNVGALQDKCAPDAICTLAPTALCVGMPTCGSDGGCPDGGSVSNACNLQPDGGHIMPGKGAICLLTQCAVASDCRPDVLCAHASAGVPWGICQLGTTGDPCASGADCASAAVCQPPDAGTDAGSTCACVINTPDAGVCAGK